MITGDLNARIACVLEDVEINCNASFFFKNSLKYLATIKFLKEVLVI